jgi:hypothetical protein
MGRLPRPAADVSLHVPDSLKLAIADAIILYSRIEGCMMEIAWAAIASNRHFQTQIAWGSLGRDVDQLRGLIEECSGIDLRGFWDTLKDLGIERTIIVQGVWMTIDGAPYVQSRRFAESAEIAVPEAFGHERFETFQRRGASLLQVLTDLLSLVREEPDE